MVVCWLNDNYDQPAFSVKHIEHNWKLSATKNAQIKQCWEKVQNHSKMSAIRKQFGCNSNAKLEKNAIVLQFVCISSAQILQCNKIMQNDYKQMQTECKHSAIHIGPGGIHQKAKHMCTIINK